MDADELSGHLGFQIHGGDDDIEIHWRDARLRRLGAHGWRALEGSQDRMKFGEIDALRARVSGDAALCSVEFADGSKQELPLTKSKYWHKGGHNRVTVVRSGTRFVVMLDDDHIHRLDAGKVPVAVSFKNAEGVRDWLLCERKD